MAKSRFTRAAMLAALAAPTLLTRNAPTGIDPDERRQPMAGFQGHRLMGFAPGSYNSDTRTVEAVLSSGSAVRRYFFTEELEISPTAVDLARAVSGLVPLLDSHDQFEADAVIGNVSNVRVEGDQLLGTLTFGQTDRAKQIEGMVGRGELKGVSIGYSVKTWEIQAIDGDTGMETWRATRWELLEVSLVSVPADANAGVRALSGPPSPGTGATAATEEDENMRRNLPGGASTAAIAAATAAAAAPPTDDAARAAAAAAAAPAVAAPAAAPAVAAAPAPAATPQIARFSGADAVAFVALGRDLGVETRATELVQQNEAGQVGVDAARAALLLAAGERQRTETAPARAAAISITRDGDETTRNAIVGAIVARATRSEVPDGSREYMGWRLLEIAASRAGIDTRRERDPIAILRAANTSSDFPKLLEAAANKILLARYTTAQPTYQRIAARRDLTDFKATKLLRVGDFPTLVQYQEDGEIQAGTINEGRESVILGSYGRILRLSRQAIVNDDLGAFDSVFGSIGMVVARFENTLAYSVKAANSAGGPKLADGVNFFHASHANLAASGTVADVTNLGLARAAMRKQKDLDGNALNIAPAIILTGPDIETAVQQVLSPIQAQQAGNVNPFAGTLQHAVDANITGNSWELYANPNELPAFNYGYLADAPGPRVMTEEPFNTDGIAFRVTEDFYFGAVDYRAAYRNPGA
jgi:HK97 family phage prohead protease